jgi:hypothetical protein
MLDIYVFTMWPSCFSPSCPSPNISVDFSDLFTWRMPRPQTGFQPQSGVDTPSMPLTSPLRWLKGPPSHVCST